MLGKVFGRARFLYALTVGLTIAFAGASAVLGTPWAAAATPATGNVAFALEVISFHRSYSLTDVLVLYTLVVLAAGPALWLMSRGGTAIVLGLSFGAWSLAQISLALVPRAWSIVDGGFPFAAWQLLFFLGLAIGYHRERIAVYLRPARLVAVGVAAVLALLAVEAIAKHVVSGWTGLDTQELLFDKNDARIGRILALLGAASFLYAAATVAWVPLRRAAGWLLMPLGQRSLFAYGVQLFVVAFWSSELMAPVRLDRENALFQGAAVLMVWAACRLVRPEWLDLRAVRERITVEAKVIAEVGAPVARRVIAGPFVPGVRDLQIGQLAVELLRQSSPRILVADVDPQVDVAEQLRLRERELHRIPLGVIGRQAEVGGSAVVAA
jgi:hypothetical protein